MRRLVILASAAATLAGAAPAMAQVATCHRERIMHAASSLFVTPPPGCHTRGWYRPAAVQRRQIRAQQALGMRVVQQVGTPVPVRQQ